MQFKNIFALIFVLWLSLMMTGKGYSFQGTGQENLLVEGDSLMLKLRQDSIDSLFTTTYQGIIYDNPNRESYIQYKLRSLKEQEADPLLLPEDFVVPFHEEINYGTIKESRPLWVLVTAFSLIFCVGMIRVVFPTEFKIIIEAYYRERLLQQVSKEDSIATSWPYVFLYGIFSLALGLFIVVLVSEFKDREFLNARNYLRASGIIASLFILKILIVRFISFVFELDKIVREYVAVIYLVYFNSMLFLLPFLLFVTLLPSSYFIILLTLFVTFVSLIFIYRLLRTAMHLFSNTKFSISYLIIYLCTLEIAPILLLIRALGN